MDRALQWFLYYDPKGGHQFKIMVASSVCGEVVFISPTIGTNTPRTGDSAILAFMCGDDLKRLKKGEPLRIGIIHLLSGTRKYVLLTSSLFTFLTAISFAITVLGVSVKFQTLLQHH